MTRNQIEYSKLLETQRSNRAQEAQTRIRDENARALGFANLGETNRHNLVTESQNQLALDETSRHNLATEKHNAAVLAESARHNLETESLGRDTLSETVRHNQAAESETNRHNLSTESIQQYQADTARYSALETSRHNLASEVELGRHNLATEAETERSNRAREVENERSNRAREDETNRHNLQSEALGRSQVALGYAELQSLDDYRNKQVSLERDRLTETIRNDIAMNKENQRYHTLTNLEQVRSHQASEEEISKHNRELERLQSKQLSQQWSLQGGQLEETIRSHLADEALTKERQSNQAQHQFWQDVSSLGKTFRDYLPLFGGKK